MSDINNIRRVDATLAVSEQQTSDVVAERQGAVESGKVMPADHEQAAVAEQQMDEAVRNIADFVQHVSRDLHFSVDDESGRTVMTVTDRDTQEVVRQVPSEEVLVMSRIVKSMTPLSPKGLLLQSEA